MVDLNDNNMAEKQLEKYREQIRLAGNRDAKAERVLRILLADIAEDCPLPALLKISNFLADVIYADADREAAEQN